MLRRAKFVRLCLGVWLGVAVAGPLRAEAANFEVKPVTISLSPSRTSDILTIENESAQALRLQVSVYAWSQDSRGRPQLKATDDLVVFPPLLQVAPNSDSLLRIGSATPFSSIEKPYRLLISEMPPPASAEQKQQTKQAEIKVVILNRVSMPVFLQPARIIYGETLSQPMLQHGHLSFEVKNDAGNVHLVAAPKVVGYGDQNTVVYSGTPGGGYILAGDSLDCALDIPSAECRKIRRLEISVGVTKPAGWINIKQDELKSQLNVSPDECGAATGAAVSR